MCKPVKSKRPLGGVARLFFAVVPAAVVSAMILAGCSSDKESPTEPTREYTLTVKIDTATGGTVWVSYGTDKEYRDGDKLKVKAGDKVKVTVYVNGTDGYVFTGWSGASQSEDYDVTITMDGNKTITANFQLKEYTLTVDASPANGGYVSLYPIKTFYKHGDTVIVTATDSAGWDFTGWSGPSVSAGLKTNPLSFIMTGNISLTANFAPDPCIASPYLDGCPAYITCQANPTPGCPNYTDPCTTADSLITSGCSGYDPCVAESPFALGCPRQCEQNPETKPGCSEYCVANPTAQGCDVVLCATNPGPNCLNYCDANPTTKPGCPGYCEANPNAPGCSATNPCTVGPGLECDEYCMANPSASGCETNQCAANPTPACPGYCDVFPTAQGCPGYVDPCVANPFAQGCPRYCEQNPETKPECPGYDQCAVNPSAAGCPGYCIANPDEPECANDPCAINPTPDCPGYCDILGEVDPRCPKYCEANPTAQGCGGVDQCVSNPYAVGCPDYIACQINPTPGCPNYVDPCTTADSLTTPGCPGYDQCVANPSLPECQPVNQCVANPYLEGCPLYIACQTNPTPECPNYVDPCTTADSLTTPGCSGYCPSTDEGCPGYVYPVTGTYCYWSPTDCEQIGGSYCKGSTCTEDLCRADYGTVVESCSNPPTMQYCYWGPGECYAITNPDGPCTTPCETGLTQLENCIANGFVSNLSDCSDYVPPEVVYYCRWGTDCYPLNDPDGACMEPCPAGLTQLQNCVQNSDPQQAFNSMAACEAWVSTEPDYYCYWGGTTGCAKIQSPNSESTDNPGMTNLENCEKNSQPRQSFPTMAACQAYTPPAVTEYCNYGTCVGGSGWSCTSGGCYVRGEGDTCSGGTIVTSCPAGTKPPNADY